jgi:hypothetical protein
MAPGDNVNVVVNLLNTGTPTSDDGMELTASATNSTPLTTATAGGLRMTLTSCSLPWSPSDACPGRSVRLLAGIPVADLSRPTPLPPVGFAAGGRGWLHLRLSVRLPDYRERTVNGRLPAGSTQGCSTTLIWTFTERDAI